MSTVTTSRRANLTSGEVSGGSDRNWVLATTFRPVAPYLEIASQ